MKCSKKIKDASLIASLAIAIVPILFISRACAIDEDTLEQLSASNIMFYDPEGSCKSGYTSGVCGKTAKEKYWAALREHFSAEASAGILGNIMNEGGFSPTSTEACTELWAYDFSADNWGNGWSWDRYYNNDCSTSGYHDACKSGGKPTGVGAFGITSGRSEYLHKINDASPDLIKYYQEPGKYGYGACSKFSLGSNATWGDALLEAIGEADYNALVELEINEMYTVVDNLMKNSPSFMGNVDMDEFNSKSVEDAAAYFAAYYERCSGCSGGSEQAERVSAAKAAYEEMKNFNCSKSSKTTTNPVAIKASTAIKSDVAGFTLVGDSISVLSASTYEKMFPSDSYLAMVSGRFSGDGAEKGGDKCSGDVGGLSVLKQIAKGNGSIKTVVDGQACKDLAVDKNSLKNNIVWEMGTNNSGSSNAPEQEAAVIDEVIKIADGRNVFLVTVFNGDERYTENYNRISEKYRQIADSHDNVFIVDWANAVKDDVSKYLQKEDYGVIHPTAAGSELMAQLIIDAIAENGGKGCNSYSGDQEYPEYIQWDKSKPWSDIPYSQGTVATSGCGPTSMAMLATAITKTDIFPQDIIEITNKVRAYPDSRGPGMTELDKLVGDVYGLEVVGVKYGKSKDTLKQKLREYLEQGYMIHISGAGSAPFTTGGHYVGIFAIDGDTLKVADPNGGNKDYSIEEFANAGPHYAFEWEEFSAIRASGAVSGKPCNSNTCKNKTGGNGEIDTTKGLTKEQAEKLVAFYKSSEVSIDKYGLDMAGLGADSKKNCVAFSAFFVQHFTKVGIGGHKGLWAPYGYGNSVVKGLKDADGFETGTEPKPFSIFSEESSFGGHTGVVVGVDGDTIITAEANWMVHDGEVRIRKASEIHNVYGDPFAYATSMDFNEGEMARIVGK